MPNDDCLLDIKLVAKIGQIFRILFDGAVFLRSTAFPVSSEVEVNRTIPLREKIELRG